MSSMLTNLIYTSQRKADCTPEEISKILDACNRNNSHKEITGVLLYSDDMFLQYLEGKRKDIFDLYDSIKLDERHEDVVMVGCRFIDKRIFPTWNMGKKQVDDNGFEFISGEQYTTKKELDNILNNQDNQKLVSSIQNLFG